VVGDDADNAGGSDPFTSLSIDALDLAAAPLLSSGGLLVLDLIGCSARCGGNANTTFNNTICRGGGLTCNAIHLLAQVVVVAQACSSSSSANVSSIAPLPPVWRVSCRGYNKTCWAEQRTPHSWRARCRRRSSAL
jgi:hypothetical protein